jgi:rhodanese-related sulfurtransferase
MKKIIVSMCIIGLLLVPSGMSINALKTGNTQVIYISNDKLQNSNNGITNITAQDAYDMLTNTGDGLQIPIDVRRIDEWRPQRIDTPIPEHPRWYLWDLIKNATILPKFLDQYDGCEIIVYCKGGYRSWHASNSIYDAGFNGVIYNMIGGITAWNDAGLPTTTGGIYEITVNETMLLCSDTGNGIQKLIDVRILDDWNTGFIDTPWPESPIWYVLDKLKDEYYRSLFMEEYIGDEVILYSCCGYQSSLGNYELYYDNFTGTQYNVLGGIKEWKEAGLPIRNNTPPTIPTISCEADDVTKLKINTSYNFTFSTTDSDNDGVCFFIDWGDGETEWTVYSDEDIIATHTFFDKRTTYNITSYAKDFYGNESGLGNLIVRTPKNKMFNFNFLPLSWLFEQFPNLFLIIRQLLRL